MSGAQELFFIFYFVEFHPFGQVCFILIHACEQSKKKIILKSLFRNFNCFMHGVPSDNGIVTSTESEEGIAQAIIRGKVDFTRDPWPKVSDEAKHLVKRMLDPNPFTRITVQEVLGMCYRFQAKETVTVF